MKLICKVLIIYLMFINPVYAMDIESNSKNAILSGIENNIIYDVDISWDSMKFMYNVIDSYNWDINSNKYVLNRQASWVNNNGNITLSNKSNYYTITALFNYNSDSNYDFINGTFTINPLILNAKETGVSKLVLSGTLDKNIVSFTKIGTITITIS